MPQGDTRDKGSTHLDRRVVTTEVLAKKTEIAVHPNLEVHVALELGVLKCTIQVVRCRIDLAQMSRNDSQVEGGA